MRILLVSSHGFKVVKEKGRIVVKYNNDDKKEPVSVPLKDLDLLVISARGSITTTALKALSLNGIPVVFVVGEKPVAIYSPLFAHGTVIVRREQMLAYKDGRGLDLAKKFSYATTMNKYYVLKYYAKSRKMPFLREYADDIKVLAEEILQVDGDLDRVRNKILGYEGRAAKIYFEALTYLFPSSFGFSGRNKRKPKDPVNAFLSYGYVVLNSIVTYAISIVGLEPFAGYLHADRSGKPSLILDLAEEFRQPIVDTLALNLFSKRILKHDDFDYIDNEVKLNKKGKEKFFTYFNRKLESLVYFEGNHITFKAAILRQARKIARFLVHGANYSPFVWRWYS